MKSLLIVLFTLAVLPSHAQIDLVVPYSNKQYKLEYPPTWMLDTSKSMGTEFYILAPRESKEDNFNENINLIIQQIGDMTLESFVEISEGQVKSLGENATIFESKKLKKGATEFHKIIYEMSRQGFKLKLVQYYFIHKNKAYVLTFTTEPDKFNTYINTAEKILDSFTILN